MLGLAEQVGGDELRVGGGVRDHEHLGRPRQQVDADAPEQLALGLGDVRVAGADEHVDRLGAAEPERHRGQRLHAAEAEHLVGAGGRDRVQHRRMHAPPRAAARTPTTLPTPASLATATVMNDDASIG